MVDNDVKRLTIAAVDREIDGLFRMLRFSPRLEQCYEDETRASRERYMLRTTQLAILLYDLFCLTDYLMMRDVFWIALLVRSCVFTPMLLVLCFVINRGPPCWIREGAASLSTVMSITVTMAVVGMSRSPDMVVYQTGDVLIMVFCAVVQRLRIRYAVATMIGVLVVQLGTASTLHDMSPRVIVYNALFFSTASVLLLAAAYALEREQRRSYLLDLRARLLNDRLERTAKQDALTGLWNRRHLETVMTDAWLRAETTPTDMAVILVDIDFFKTFNDSYGHLEGDQCLRQFAARLQTALAGDVTASAVRFGGEEFLIFIEGVREEVALRVAERIKTEIKAAAIPHPAIGEGKFVTASFGVATGPARGLSMNKLVASADDALYLAKRAGRDCIRAVVVDVDAKSTVESPVCPALHHASHAESL